MVLSYDLILLNRDALKDDMSYPITANLFISPTILIPLSLMMVMSSIPAASWVIVSAPMAWEWILEMDIEGISNASVQISVLA